MTVIEVALQSCDCRLTFATLRQGYCDLRRFPHFMGELVVEMHIDFPVLLLVYCMCHSNKILAKQMYYYRTIDNYNNGHCNWPQLNN